MAKILTFTWGLLFGGGLIISGMANPAKVLGFLDITGAWDPSLAVVMGAALAGAFLPLRMAATRSRSLLDDPMHMPTRRDITPRLVLGSVAFGIGWGLAGFCPGPAIVGVGAGLASARWFTAAMLAGMALFTWLEQWRKARVPARPASTTA